jgi:hypothetical protein
LLRSVNGAGARRRRRKIRKERAPDSSGSRMLWDQAGTQGNDFSLQQLPPTEITRPAEVISNGCITARVRSGSCGLAHCPRIRRDVRR